jgi:fructose-bisphosphate aldolase class I
MDSERLNKLALQLLSPGKGILAADQSSKSMDRQLEAIGATPDAETRRRYRELLFTAPGIEKYVTGVILYDATIRNSIKDGTPFVDVLISKGIVPIIKVDKSTVELDGFPGEVVTEGLDGLKERFLEYYEMGARASKWRAVINIGNDLPTSECIKFNCLLLARYARLAQEAGIVPIVEPEVIFAGSHSLERAEEVTTLTLQTLFTGLNQYRVDLRGLILKSSMVLAGSNYGVQTSPEEVAEASIRTFSNSVPHEVPGIVFLSGGQTPERATSNLNAIGKLEKEMGGLPWQVAFSFSRGIEEPVQKTWLGKEENVKAAQDMLIETLKKNSLADAGMLSS